MNENWIKILEIIKEDEILEYLKKEFGENNIKYKIELEEKWEGIRIPEYIGKFVIYVQEKFKEEAEKILIRYYEKGEEIIEVIDKGEDNEAEKESKKVAQRQKVIIKIYTVIILCMIISTIIVGLIIRI